MKILHLNAFYGEGGAARATNRLHRNLLSRDKESWMVVRRKEEDNKNVIQCESDGKLVKLVSTLRPYLDAFPLVFFRKKRNLPWSISWLANQFIRVQSKISPDIVHVHWVGAGFLSLRNLSKIESRMVWTLHDAWPFTGGCHIINNCTAFKQSCGKCPQLGSGNHYDLSWLGWHRKKNLYNNNKITFVAPSHWIAEQARSSSLLSRFRIEVIPNGLDTNTFQPVDKQLSRKLLGLPQDKKIILFGAMSATSDSNKGFDKLQKSLLHLKKLGFGDNVELVIFGSSEPANKPDMGFHTTYLGRFHDDVSLAIVYSAADLMCVPSIQESFGQTATEAMSCGTPVVSYATSGLLDIVDHKVTGYLAQPYDEMDFAKGIEFLISDSSCLQTMSKDARNKVLKCFDISIVASKYIELYEQVLRNE